MTQTYFLCRERERIGRRIVALQAEDHYIRVFTRRGSAQAARIAGLLHGK